MKNHIAATTEQLKSATTDAEVQKLQGVFIGSNAALNNTDYEINQATTSALVQDIATALVMQQPPGSRSPTRNCRRFSAK